MDIKDCVIPSRGQSPFIDVQLAKHKYKKFGKRALSDIGASSIHQTAATSTFVGVAYYHTSPENHICKDGCPGICYHFTIDYDGTIYQVNDLTDIVYSSGKKKNYRAESQADCFSRWGKHFNNYSISVLVRGSFDGVGFKGGQGVTPEQIAALDRFAHWATQEAAFADNKPIELRNFLGHCHVNKKACPGFTIQDWIEKEVWTGKFLEEPEEIEPNRDAFVEALWAMLKGLPIPALPPAAMALVGAGTRPLVGAAGMALSHIVNPENQESNLFDILKDMPGFTPAE